MRWVAAVVFLLIASCGPLRTYQDPMCDPAYLENTLEPNADRLDVLAARCVGRNAYDAAAGAPADNKSAAHEVVVKCMPALEAANQDSFELGSEMGDPTWGPERLSQSVQVAEIEAADVIARARRCFRARK